MSVRIALPLAAGLVAAGVLLLINVDSLHTGAERPAAPLASQSTSRPTPAPLPPVSSTTSTPVLASPPVAIEGSVSLTKSPGDPADAALANEALHHPDPAVREEAVHALGERGNYSALLTLQQALTDSETSVQEAAIRALTEIGGDDAVAALSRGLTAPDVPLRLLTVDALGRIGGASGIVVLQQALTDTDPGVRDAAGAWLAELGLRTD